MRIVFFGTPSFAVPTLEGLLDSIHNVIAVVTQPDRPRGRGKRVTASPTKQVAESHGIEVLQPHRMKELDFVAQLRALGPDLGVVAAYGKILPDELLTLPRLGLINVHASLLPQYRGAAPIHRAVMAGETKTGITIIKLIRKMDAGPMLLKATRPIGPDETSEIVERDLATIGADLLIQAVNDLSAGHVITEEQDHTHATLAPRLTKDDGIIDWALPATQIHNQVRGLHPWPHAFTHLDGHRYLILRTSVTEAPLISSTSKQPVPGEVIEASGEHLTVTAGFGTTVSILEIQPEGKRPQPARAFLSGYRITVGTKCRGKP